MFYKYRHIAAFVALSLWFAVPSVAFEMIIPYKSCRLRHPGSYQTFHAVDSLSAPRNSIFKAVSRDENESCSESQERHRKTNAIALLLAEYGLVFVLFHYAVFFVVWAAFYVVLKLGLAEEASHLPGFLTNYLPAVEADSTNGELVVASFFLMELVGPARSALDIFATPIIARQLRKSTRWTSFEKEVGIWWDQLAFRKKSSSDL